MTKRKFSRQARGGAEFTRPQKRWIRFMLLVVATSVGYLIKTLLDTL